MGEHDIALIVYDAMRGTLEQTECPAIKDIIQSAAAELRGEIERVQNDDHWSEFLTI